MHTPFTWLAAIASVTVLLTACGAAPDEPTSTPTQSDPPAQTTTAGTPSDGSIRTQNDKLGVSYVVPAGFQQAVTPEIPGLLVTAFTLGKPRTDRVVTQYQLAKLGGPYSYIEGTSASMSNAELLETFIASLGPYPGDQIQGEPQRAEWLDTSLPGTSALVLVKSEAGEVTGDYRAFLGEGDHRFAVEGTLTQVPAGQTFDSVRTLMDAFAQSLQPL